MDYFIPKLAKEIAREGEIKAKAKIRSTQLRQGLYTQEEYSTPEAAKYDLIVPHYWAAYVHDGRGPVRPKSATMLVWFRNPNNDPRLSGGRSPVRARGAKRLSSGQFKKWADINRQIIRRYRQATGKTVLTSTDYEAMKLPMIVTRYSPGTYRPSKVYPFFSNEPGGGMEGFLKQASAIAQRGASAHIKDRLRKAGLLNAKKSVTVRV